MIAAAAALLLAASPTPSATWLGPKPPPIPKRIATLAPSLTETVIALGLGDRLVGVSRYDDLPEVAKLPRLGGLMDPSAEAVVGASRISAAQPSPASAEVLRRLSELGLPILELPHGLDRRCARGPAHHRRRLLWAQREGDALAQALSTHLAETTDRMKGLPVRASSGLWVGSPGRRRTGQLCG